MATTTRTIAIPQQLDPVTVLGPVDEVLREVERAFPDLTIIVRGNRIAIMSRSSKSESQAAQAEHVIENIIQAAYTAPMDADTVRRMLDQNVLKNPVRATRPGHGRVVEELRLADRQQEHTSNRENHADRRKPHVRSDHLCARQAGACQNGWSDHICQCHRITYHHICHRAGRHRQNIPCSGESGTRIPR